jgi:single-strand DNA-binding protein
MAIYENSIHLKGFIGNHAQVKNDSHGKEFVILSLCTKSSYRNRQTDQLVTSTDWHRLVAFGPLAELAKTLVKGDYVLTVGELRSTKYPVPGGKKRRVWEIRVAGLEVLTRKETITPG